MQRSRLLLGTAVATTVRKVGVGRADIAEIRTQGGAGFLHEIAKIACNLDTDLPTLILQCIIVRSFLASSSVSAISCLAEIVKILAGFLNPIPQLRTKWIKIHATKVGPWLTC